LRWQGIESFGHFSQYGFSSHKKEKQNQTIPLYQQISDEGFVHYHSALPFFAIDIIQLSQRM
jgi:hypothetical protein